MLSLSLVGKLGGHVGARNSSGYYLRTKVTPSNPQTIAQGTVRNNFAANSQGWRGLTEAQRLAWDNAVSNFVDTDIFGDSITPSGFQLFVGINNNLRFISESVLTQPPLPSSVPAFDSLSLAVANGADTMTATFSPAIAVTEKVIVSATAPQSAGKNFVKSEYRMITIADSTDLSPKDFMTEYKAKFGSTPAVGTKIFFRLQQVNIATGLSGAIISTSSIVVA